MTQPANVIDFALHCSRRQAQACGRQRWALCAEQAAQCPAPWLQPVPPGIEPNRG